MKIIYIALIFYGLSILWLAFEFWRAPLLEEQSDGSWKTIRPAKKFSDLFKRKSNGRNDWR